MTGLRRIVVVGDALVDRDIEGDVRRICPDAPAPVLDESSVRSRPGGAALAAAIAAAWTDGSGPAPAVTLVTAVGPDPAGRDLVALAEESGVDVVAVATAAATAEKIRLRSAGQTLMRLDRGGSGLAPAGADPAARSGGLDMAGVAQRVAGLLAGAGAVLVADYGRGLTRDPILRRLLADCGRPVVWDPHPRGPEPVAGCRLLTPNAGELLDRFPADGGGPAARSIGAVTAAARRAQTAWAADAVAVTRGAEGALMVTGDGPPLAVPVPARHGGDTCGAGDCFAAGVTVRLAAGQLTSEAVTGAVADAARFVAAGGAAAFGADGGSQAPGSAVAPPAASGRPVEADALAASVRRAGGTVVAAGGCFDLLHAGHVALLQSARALGDCLIVCLNSDRSVRRLKGPGRPVNPEGDRAATLAALDCVDGVAIFDEDTPEAVIRRLRPAIWVKGGDYDAARLPEAAVLSAWGGQAVVLPYLAGRSTTSLLARAATPEA